LISAAQRIKKEARRGTTKLGTDDEMRRVIVDEVNKQLGPTHALLRSLGDSVSKVESWQLSFWSNGSGRPPGFFQTRMKQDDERFATLKQENEAQSALLEDVKTYMTESRTVRIEREKGEKERDERRKTYWALAWKIGAPIATSLLGLLTWAAAKALPVVKILWEDYLRAHPAVSERLKDSAQRAPVLSYYRQHQESGMPQGYRPME
jgi:hypothetical protein